MKRTCKLQKTVRGFYINIPKEISEKMEMEKGETILINVIDKDTMEIKLIED